MDYSGQVEIAGIGCQFFGSGWEGIFIAKCEILEIDLNVLNP